MGMKNVKLKKAYKSGRPIIDVADEETDSVAQLKLLDPLN